MSTTSAKLSNVENEARTALESSREFVSDHPMSTSLTLFGIGLGLGIVATTLLTSRQSQDRNVAQRIGQRMMDSVSRALPESWTSRS